MRIPAVLATLVLAVSTATSAASAQSPAAAPSRDEALRLGRITFERTFAANIDALVASADSAMGTPEAIRERLTAGIRQISEQLGNEVATVSEKVMLVNGAVQYWRTSDFTEVPVPIVFRVVVGPAGKWRGFTATTQEQAPVGTEILP